MALAALAIVALLEHDPALPVAPFLQQVVDRHQVVEAESVEQPDAPQQFYALGEFGHAGSLGRDGRLTAIKPPTTVVMQSESNIRLRGGQTRR